MMGKCAILSYFRLFLGKKRRRGVIKCKKKKKTQPNKQTQTGFASVSLTHSPNKQKSQAISWEETQIPLGLHQEGHLV